MSEDTALDIVLASYRDMFGVKLERANEIHRGACIEVWKLREARQRLVELVCPECDSRIMDNGYCMMNHWCGKPLK